MINIEDGSANYPFSHNRSRAAIDMAIEKVNAEYNDTLEISATYIAAPCGSQKSASKAARSKFSGTVPAYIGPGKHSSDLPFLF